MSPRYGTRRPGARHVLGCIIRLCALGMTEFGDATPLSPLGNDNDVAFSEHTPKLVKKRGLLTGCAYILLRKIGICR